jgi:hypothetical protein
MPCGRLRPVVESVGKAHDPHAAQFDYDLQSIDRALKDEPQSGRNFVKQFRTRASIELAPSLCGGCGPFLRVDGTSPGED